MLREFHPSEEELLMAVDGELSAADFRRVNLHLEACWACRARSQEMDSAIGEFVRFQRQNVDSHVPPSDGPRALLKAQLAQLAESQRGQSPQWLWAAMAIAVLAVAGVTGSAFFRISQQYAAQPADVTIPNPKFTPGATVLLSRQAVCRETSEKEKPVPKAIQRRVFDEYGIRAVDPGAYQVDYLITPALGGADDIHNLWPESNRAKLWNARVKDELEDHLRDLVCGGRLDLATAQRELAGGWIEAYKKYFHTDRPL
jgi:hypothetical protein